MKKSILAAMLWMGSALSLMAQQPDGFQNKRFIEVNGTHESEIVPDEIYLTITLLERMDNRDKVTIEKQESELKKHIRDLGIPAENLSLNSADADYRKIRTFRKDVLISKSYLLKVNSAAQLSKVYEKLDQMNAHDAYISRYTHSKILELQKECRIKALKAAKEKADYLLAALSQQAGAPLQIMETENYVQENPMPYGRMYKNTMAIEQSDMSAGEPEISFKKIKLRAGFIVKYEIATK